jgi:AcrR family transcriptional regulator
VAAPGDRPIALDGERTQRRRITERQSEAFDRLLEAAATEAREHGYEGVTVRSAAAGAGVSPAAAYSLIASKDHLLAEVLWREMVKLPAAEFQQGATPAQRVVTELRVLGTFMADDPVLATAGTAAIFGAGADVRDVRVRMGEFLTSRLAAALGEYPDPAALRALDLLYAGTLLSMGMGHLSGAEVPDVLAESAMLVMGGAL